MKTDAIQTALCVSNCDGLNHVVFQFMDTKTTICAVATAPGPAGVAMVRISGPAAPALAQTLTGLPRSKLQHGRMRLTDFVDGPDRIDTGYIVVFYEPRSFTGQDVVECHVHGSAAITNRLMDAICARGARPAERGEFSRRAFLSGKLDLAQAEGLLDLVSSSSEAARSIALNHLDGRVSDAIATLREPIVRAMAEVEARLDFSTAEDVGAVPKRLRQDLTDTAVRLRAIASTANAGRARMHGVQVALYGAPNAGKSTLFNGLVGLDRALVHEQPGTTRDIVEARGELVGIAITWIDTAGIRRADHAVEAAGIERANQAIASADIVIWLTDSSQPDPELIVPPGASHRRILRLHSKTDLPTHPDFQGTSEVAAQQSINALSNADVARVARLVADTAQQLAQPPISSDIIVTRSRQALAMVRAADAIDRALTMLVRDDQLELAAADLRDAATALGEVTGEIASDDLLDAIFSQFCIGK